MPAAHLCPYATRPPPPSGGFAVSGGDHIPHPTDRAPAQGREDADGRIWFTIAEAAAFIGGSPQTIYSWERRGHLTNPKRDERGRRIYSQQQIATAHRTARQNTAATRRIAA
ncbi:MerR family DNA-binding transcriptional regulator [Streptomyces sp. NPDC093065]|uniref:MerR family DNA-binding transcriptional regulator n=1 Tax=Streptomyces sp. NPDC093065 TaxID=3366021 RepID=UPI0037F85992